MEERERHPNTKYACVACNDFVNLEKYLKCARYVGVVVRFLSFLFYTIKHWAVHTPIVCMYVCDCVCLFYVRVSFPLEDFYFKNAFLMPFLFQHSNFFLFFVFFLLLLHLYCRIYRCIASWIAPAPITEAPIDLAKKCDPAECVLPYCFCSKDGTIIPGGLQAEDVSRHFSARL